jgi:hypothetical protein
LSKNYESKAGMSQSYRLHTKEARLKFNRIKAGKRYNSCPVCITYVGKIKTKSQNGH